MAGQGKNHISVGLWMWMLFVLWLPCIGFVMGIVWAFTARSETGRNFFLARIAWGFIGIAFWGSLVALGYRDAIEKYANEKIVEYAKEHQPKEAKPAATPGPGTPRKRAAAP